MPDSDPHPDRPPAQHYGQRHVTDSEPESGGQLAEQQVAVLIVAADVARDADASLSYRIGSRPTEFLVGESDIGVEVPPEDGLVWAAVHQDAIVVQLPDRTGPLAGEPVAALLRRGSAS